MSDGGGAAPSAAARVTPLARVITFGLLSAFVLGLRFLWASPRQAEWFQAHLGYYVVLALLILTIVCFSRLSRTRGWLTWSYWRPHRFALVFVAAGSCFLHVHEPHMLRVLFDEPTHALVALSMHLDKTAMGATVSNYVGEAFVTGDPYAVSRPYFFPLLVSVLHDLTGYRVANVFVLNALLTPLVLLGAYLLAHRLGGRLAAWVAVALLVSVPLLAQNVTSGGYDVLNLTLVAALILLTMLYARSSDGERGAAMDLSLALALLLASTRAESVLYVVPWGVVTLVLWWRSRRVEMTRVAAIAPLFLIPAFMSNLHMTHNDVAMVAAMRTGGEAFFGVANLPRHLADAIYYFFRFDRESTNSLALSLLGGVGCVAWAVRVAGNARARRATATDAVFALFAVTAFAVYAFVLTQFWSSPLDPLAARFSLPVTLVLAVMAGWMVSQVAWLAARPRVVGGALLLWVVLAAAPAMSRATATSALTPAFADRYFLEFAKARDRRSAMYAMQGNASFIVNGFASTVLQRVRVLPAAHVRALKAGLYRDLFVMQTLQPVDGGGWKPQAGQELPPNIALATVDERAVGPFVLARISRFVGYTKPDGTLVTTASEDPDVAVRKNFATYEEWQRYRLSLYP